MTNTDKPADKAPAKFTGKSPTKSVDDLLFALKERAKELNCLYEVEEWFNRPEASLPDVLEGIVHALPAGWQYPDVCVAKITFGDFCFQNRSFKDTQWVQRADIHVQDRVVGNIAVYYTEERPMADEGPFLKEERKLIETIADRLSRRIFHERLKTVFESKKRSKEHTGQCWIIIDLLKKTDTKLLTHITRKMLNALSWSGISEANQILERFNPILLAEQADLLQETNRPAQMKTADNLASITDEVFLIAEQYLGEKEVLNNIQKWITEDRTNFLVKILENPGSSLGEIVGAIERFQYQGLELSTARERGVLVSLIRKFLNDEPRFIQVAKNVLELSDFYDLLHHFIFPSGSFGKLGGKGSGLFLASQVLKNCSSDNELLHQIRIPKAWYLTSDGISNFIAHNDLEELVEQKYEDIGKVRQEYPYVVHIFKNSRLPSEIVNGLSAALDDFGETPLIVRSSSLLEDRFGASFAGKYKSLFIANQGSKRDRLIGLMDAITEVYASTFSPDPIEYRIEHGIVDFNEEMGILIQEVVGKKVGHYFLPAFAGVAFAKNEFRWSQRIRREDGLIRMVPGLGTRAVDRTADDYPILIAPGQPNLRVNVTIEEKTHYSPKKIDVINLRTNSFETIEIRDLLREFGEDFPLLNHVASVLRNERLVPASLMENDLEKDHYVITFDGLFNNTPFISTIRAMIDVLQQEFGTPVDIEFAHDGASLYLLQCRPQSHSTENQPTPIPADIPREKILFSANRFVTNGKVSNITHIVYVDADEYSELQTRSDLLAVGRAIGKLNQILPKRQFILMGPGRWGSRGDIKLGINVSYSDINNTAMLIEIARKRKEYMPELSFGTHFFQDLVEAQIRYLPLYPDESGSVFQEQFFTSSRNILADLLPEYSSLSGPIRVIDVRESAGGRELQVLMNGERDEAVAVLTEHVEEKAQLFSKPHGKDALPRQNDDHWRWRSNAVDHIAASMEPDRFGVAALYLFGSTKNGTAGPKSDIDLLIHFRGTETQRKELMAWLEGWSLSLAEANYLRTGYKTDGLLDIHVITDEDISNQTSWAVKIGAVSDAPRKLTIGNQHP